MLIEFDVGNCTHQVWQNTVDVIFPAYPAFLYANPDLAKYLLLPLFEYQATGQYPNKWAVHDMGKLDVTHATPTRR